MTTVVFNSKTYITSVSAGPLPAEAINVADLSSSEQVTLYNLLSSSMGERGVKKFSDKKSATRRIIAKLLLWEKFDVDEAAVPSSDPQPAKAKTPKGVKTEPKQRKKRIMRFTFPFHGKDNMRAMRGTNTERARAVEMLKKGATFQDIEELCRQFDVERGIPSKNVSTRAYEIIRIIHYYIGYGISHNLETGIIKLHTNG